jgi:hypothetical protein
VDTTSIAPGPTAGALELYQIFSDMVMCSSGYTWLRLHPCLRPAIVSDVGVEGRPSRHGPAFIVVGTGDSKSVRGKFDPGGGGLKQIDPALALPRDGVAV